MADWITEHAWDGVDRMEAFAATVPTSTELWPQYIRKWLIQVIQAVFGGLHGREPISLPHVLTFKGGQGCNKGRWVNSLAPGDYVLTDAELHLDSGQAKDHMLQALEHPIVELAELDSTFKRSHVSMMKAFLSRRVDKIRSPYGRKATKRRRGTCFIGTVNDNKFLADATGSRRYWAVEIEGKLIWDHSIDMQQVFAQAHAEWMSGEDWNLTEDEDALRDAINHRFQAVVYEVDLLQAHLESNRDNYDQYAVMNQTEILRTVGVNQALGSATGPVQQWLLDTLGKSRKLKAANGKVRYNAWPFPRALGYEGATFGELLNATDAKRLVKWDAPEGYEEMVEKINQPNSTSTDTGTVSRSG
jgi:putative DNA primase/helicase